MSGHSKWSTIKRKKGAVDAKRGALFTKLSKQIALAVREGGGGDPVSNFKLRLAIQNAKAANMPHDNIDRAVQKATGGGDNDRLEEVIYEGYGPGGVAILVSAVTDNRNRTVAEIRHEFTRAGGNLGEAGSVAWQFESKGTLSISLNGHDADDLVLTVIDAGAEDVQVQDEAVEVQTEPSSLEDVRKTLEAAGIEVDASDLAMVPTTPVEVDDGAARQVLRLLDGLEELDDVQRVYSNADFSDAALEAYAE